MLIILSMLITLNTLSMLSFLKYYQRTKELKHLKVFTGSQQIAVPFGLFGCIKPLTFNQGLVNQ